MKILIIEDDPLLEKTLELRLTEIGHEVVLAENGRDALKAVEAHSPFDVVLCDVVMPELSGPSFIWEMRRRINNEHIGVVMMSALSDGETFIRKLELSYDHYLPKPFSFHELMNVLAGIERQKAG